MVTIFIFIQITVTVIKGKNFTINSIKSPVQEIGEMKYSERNQKQSPPKQDISIHFRTIVQAFQKHYSNKKKTVTFNITRPSEVQTVIF